MTFVKKFMNTAVQKTQEKSPVFTEMMFAVDFPTKAPIYACQLGDFSDESGACLPNSQLESERGSKPMTGRKPTAKNLVLRYLSGDVSKCEDNAAEDHELV